MFQKMWNLVALLIVVSLLLAACGSAPATPQPQPQPPAPTEAAKPTEAPQPTAVPKPTEAPQATTAPAASGKPVEIRWYIGLGTGDQPEHEVPQQKAVDAFNASHPNIHLTK